MCWYHVTFHLNLNFEHTLDVGLPGDHQVQVWWRSGHLPGRISDLRKTLQMDRRRMPLSWNELINDNSRKLKVSVSKKVFCHIC